MLQGTLKPQPQTQSPPRPASAAACTAQASPHFFFSHSAKLHQLPRSELVSCWSGHPNSACCALLHHIHFRMSITTAWQPIERSSPMLSTFSWVLA